MNRLIFTIACLGATVMSTQLDSNVSDAPDPIPLANNFTYNERFPAAAGAQISSTKGVPKTVPKIDRKIF